MLNLILLNLFLIFLSIFIYQKSNKIALKFNLLDRPDGLRKIHKANMPLIGGPIITFIVLINILFYWDQFSLSFLISFFLSIIFIFILGIYDDLKNLRPIKKLIVSSFIIGVFLILNDYLIIETIKFSSFEKKISLGYFSLPFTILCFLLVQNSLNMSDGIDGLFGTILVAVCLSILLYNYDKNFITFTFLIILIIHLFIFLFFNFTKKTFMGDSGVYVLSFIISVFLIDTYIKEGFSFFGVVFRSEQIFAILFLVGFDMFRVFIFRISSKKNPFLSDKNHLHHYLIVEMSTKKVCLIYFFNILLITFLINIFPSKTLLIYVLNFMIYFMLLLLSRFKVSY